MDRILKRSYTDWIVVAPPAADSLGEVSGFTRILPGILAPSECAALIEQAEDAGFNKASLYTDGGGREHYSDIRKSKRTMLDSRPFVDELWKRIEHVVPKTWKGKPLHVSEGAASPLNERLRILKYDSPGDEFRPHADGQYASPDGGISQITILMYLNTDYTGAYTNFLADDFNTWIPVIPTIGGITLQDQRLVHCVPPLESGIKYVVRTEVMYSA